MSTLRRLFGWSLALLFLALLLIPAAPALTGWWLEQRIAGQLETVRQWSATAGLKQLDIQLEQQRTGWFTSEYTLAVHFLERRESGEHPDLRLHTRIQHGPIRWGGLLDGALEWQWAEARTDWHFRGPILPTLTTEQWLDFNGNVHVLWRFLGHRSQSGDLRFDVASSRGEWHYRPAERQLRGSLQLPDLRLRYRNDYWQLSDVDWQFLLADTSAPLPVGQGEVGIGLARWRQGDREWQLSKLSLQALFSDFEGLSNLKASARASGIGLNGYPLSGIELDSALRGISERSLAALVPEQGWGHWRQNLTRLQQQWQQRAAEILANSEVEISHLQLQTPSGPVQGFLRTNIPPLEQMDASDTRELLRQVDLSAEASVPKSMVDTLLEDANIQERFFHDEQYRFLSEKLSEERLRTVAESAARQQLNMVLSQGLIAESGSQYWTRAALNEGRLQLNGQAVYDFNRQPN